ncbi:MAG: conjugal transfer protein TraN [Betaproteobacteria bacterium]
MTARSLAQAFLIVASLLATGNALSQAGSCEQKTKVCAEPNETRDINGFPVYRDCWRWHFVYTCRSQDTIDDCAELKARGCGQVGSTCVTWAPEGSCAMYEQAYQCLETPAKTIESTVCDTTFCQDDKAACFDTTHPPDKDFGMAAAMMEATREAGIYGIDPDKIEIFKGYSEECSIKVAGGTEVKSCCAPSGGGESFTNFSVIGVTAKAAYAVGKEELKAGSKYVYDSLFQAQDSTLIKEGLGAAAEGLSTEAASSVAASSGTSFGAYGFEFSYSAAGGFEFVGFDPYSFAIAVAIQLITRWLSCDQPEQVMALKRGQHLCSHVETYCSKKLLGGCIEKKERHCCFNSVLAKIINRQGRAQLGLTLSSCAGFNQTQLQAIDFSKIDFSEFLATIVPKNITAGETTNDVTDTANKKFKDYYGG